MNANKLTATCSLLVLLTGCGTQKNTIKTNRPQTGISLPEKVLQAVIPAKKQGVYPDSSLAEVFFQTAPKHEVRAVWLTTLGGLDWPATKANTPERRERQKAELTAILDQYQQAGINTVLFQTRVRGSVIYPSALEPWDLGLTGQYGKDPGYDPLQFAIEECHKRGMEIQAWIVAIPLGKNSLVNGYGSQSVVRKQKNLCIRSGDEWFMDPGQPDTPAYLASLAHEIVSRYDIDGINLDYIRYPEEPHLLKDTRSYKKYGKGMSLADWRRQNITRIVRAIYQSVKAIKPWVKVSSSPIGKYQDLPRYSSFGWNSHDKVFQETQEWFREGIHDEIFPMMYFDGKHFYPFAADWQENSQGRPVVPGLGIYFLDKSLKDWPLDVISRQTAVIRQLHMGGEAYFRSRFLTDNTKGIYDYARERLYRTPALQPAMTWANMPSPSAPSNLTITTGKDGSRQLTWKAPVKKDPSPLRYTIYASATWPVDLSDPKHILKTYLADTCFTDSALLSADLHRYYAVTALNGYGMESAPLQSGDMPGGEFEVAGNALRIPASLQPASGEWLIIKDAYGNAVARGGRSEYLNIASLPAGYYSISVTEKNAGTVKNIGYFFK